MYVCICNALTDKQILKALQGNEECSLKGVRHVYARLSCRPQCGECLQYARDLITSHLGNRTGDHP